MKKNLFRLLCSLFLVVVLAFAATSCGEENNILDDSDENSVTLSMWVVWEGHNENDESATDIEKAVQDAFNEIIMDSYMTKVQFTWCASVEEYKEKLAKRYDDIKQAGGITPSTGFTEDGYPTLAENQVDIVLMFDKEMYDNYAKSGKIVSINSLNTNGSVEYSNIYTTLSQYIKPLKDEGGNYYAVPNIHVFGEYTYLLVNKEAAQTFHFAEKDFTNLASTAQLVEEVYSYQGSDKVSQRVANLSPILQKFDYYNSKFFALYDGYTPGTRSKYDIFEEGTNGLIGVFWDKIATNGSINDGSMKNALQDYNYMSYLAMMNWAEANNAFALNPEEAFANHDFAVGVVKGDYNLRNTYDDYYCIVLDYPRMQTEDFYDGMWAISSYCAEPKRALKIIADLETKSDLLNVLMYGVEGAQYSYSSSKKAITSNNTYYIEPKYAGNIFNAYPDLTHGQTREWLDALSTEKNEWKIDVWSGFEYYLKDYYNEQTLIQATCTLNGVKLLKCVAGDGCNEILSISFIDALGHVDNNEDGQCDRCNICMKDHFDVDANNVCDVCGSEVRHIDTDGDGYCDEEGYLVDVSKHRKHKFVVTDESTVRAAECSIPELTLKVCECGAKEYEQTASALGHKDADQNGICDVCGQNIVKHTHQLYHTEYRVMEYDKSTSVVVNSAVAAYLEIPEGTYTRLDLLQTVSDVIFYKLFNYDATTKTLSQYMKDFRQYGANLSDHYIGDGSGLNELKTLDFFARGQDTLGNIIDDRLAGNIRRWWYNTISKN